MTRSSLRQHGFTLIEIMVVLILVGMLVSLAVANLGGGNQYRDLEQQARELFLLMQTAREQALLNNQELALMIDEEGYRFVVYDVEEDTWVEQSERLFHPRVWPAQMEAMTIAESDLPRLTSGEDDDDEEERPDIVFFSSGETTPFEIRLEIRDDDSAPTHQLQSDGIGEIVWRGPGREESATL